MFRYNNLGRKKSIRKNSSKNRKRTRGRYRLSLHGVGKYLLLAFLVAGVIFAVLLPRFVKVNKLVCKSQYGPCNLLTDERLRVLEGGSLFQARRELKKIMADDVLVGEFHSQLKLPSTLEINVLEKKPAFALVGKGKDDYALISRDGKVLAISNTSQLPYLLRDESLPEVGETLADRELFALKVIGDVYLSFLVKEGKIENDGLIIELPNGLRVIFPLEGDREYLVGAMMLIVGELEKNEDFNNISGNIGTIDLRFKNPVLK